MMSSAHALLRALGALLLLAATAAAQADFDSLKAEFEKARKKAALSYLLESQKLKTAYDGALERYIAKAQGEGDLDTLLAIRTEKERVADELSLATQISDIEDLARAQKTLNARLGMLIDGRDQTVSAAVGRFLHQLGALEGQLTRAGDIQAALALREKRRNLVKEPGFRMLSIVEEAGVPPLKWTVLFRSNRLAVWGTDTDTEKDYAIPAERVLADIEFLRVARAAEKPDYVIIPVTHDELLLGRYHVGKATWRAVTISTNGPPVFLGVAHADHRAQSTETYLLTAGLRNFSGWGFGIKRKHVFGELEPKLEAGMSWAGEDIPVETLEIAVCKGPLNEAELTHLLAKPGEASPHVSEPAPVGPVRPSRPAVAPLKGAINVPIASGEILGGARISGSSVSMGANSQIEWNLNSLRQGNYEVHVTWSGRYGKMHVQGVRNTSATRGKIVVAERNHLTGAPNYYETRQNVGTLQLGGFNKLQIINQPSGRYGSVTITKVELVPTR